MGRTETTIRGISLFTLVIFFCIIVFFDNKKIMTKPEQWEGVIAQNSNNLCGTACLTMILNGNEIDVSFEQVNDNLPIGFDGISMKDLADYSKSWGLQSKGFQYNYESLVGCPKPVILFVDNTHYVVLDSISDNISHIRDPLIGKLKWNKKELLNHWKGEVLTFEK